MPMFEKDGVRIEVDDATWSQLSPDEQQGLLSREYRRLTTSGAEDYGRGMVRGAVKGTVGAIEDAGRGLFDLAQLAGRAEQRLGGEGTDAPGTMGDIVLGADLASRDSVVGRGIDEAIPAGNPSGGASRFGELTGSLAGPLGAFAALARLARSGPAAVQTLAGQSPVMRGGEAALEHPVRATLGAHGTGAAATAGGEAAVGLSGDESFRPLGEGATALLAPTLAQRAFDKVIQTALPADNTHRAAEVFRAQESIGISPSPGSVGSPNAGYLETAAAALPFFGGPVRSRGVKQVDQAATELHDLASEVRPPHTRPAIGEADIGRTVRQGADEGLEAIDRDLDALEETLSLRAGGPEAPVRPTHTRQAGSAQLKETAHSDPRRALDRTLGDIEADVRPIHQPAQNLLETERRALQTQIENLQPGDRASFRQRQALQEQLAEVERKMRANEGIDQAKFRDQRSQLGPRTQAVGGLDRSVSKQLYRAMSDDLRTHMAKQGGPELAQDFNRLMDLESRLYAKTGSLLDGRDIQTLKAIVAKPDDTSIYRWLAEGKTLPYEKFQLLARNMAPERWRQFSADFIERMGLTTIGRQNAAGDMFSPQVFMSNWNKLADPRLKKLLMPDSDIRLRMDRLADAMEGLASRQSRGNPSGTAMVAIPMAIGDRTVSAFTGPSGAQDLGPAVARLSTQLVAQGLFMAGMMSERVARAIAHLEPGLVERLQRGLPAAAGATAADPQEP